MARADWNRRSAGFVLESLYHGAIRRGWISEGDELTLWPERVAVLFGLLDEHALIPFHPAPPRAADSDMKHVRDVLAWHRANAVRGWTVRPLENATTRIAISPRPRPHDKSAPVLGAASPAPPDIEA